MIKPLKLTALALGALLASKLAADNNLTLNYETSQFLKAIAPIATEKKMLKSKDTL
jgi:hypothetical protein